MERATRVMVGIEATYTFQGTTNKCEITDLSKSGLQIRTKQILDVGDLLRIDLFLDNEKTVFFTTVKNISSDTFYGLQIEEISNESQEKLSKFLLTSFLNSGKAARENC